MARDEVARSQPRRRRFRVTLGFLLLAVGGIAIGMARLSNSWRSQRQALAAIGRLGGLVGYDYQYVGGDPDATAIPSASPPGPVWLRHRLGDEPFQRVVQVTLIGDRYHDADLAVLADLPDLRTIILTQCSNITNDGLKHIAGQANLRYLNIYRRQEIGDAGLTYLRGLTSLETLHLDRSSVTDAGIDSLLGLRNLQELDLDNTPVSDAGLVKLKALPRLKQVYVQNSRATEAGVVALQKFLPQVKVNLGSRPGSYGR